MTSSAQLVAVGHDASRTGAPLALLSWLRWLGTRPEVSPEVWLLGGGPLVDAHAGVAPTRLHASRAEVLLGRARAVPLPRPLGRALGVVDGALLTARAGGAVDVVLANSLASWRRAASVRRRARLVCWVHELDAVAGEIVPDGQRRPLIAQTDHFIAAGARVREMLCSRWGIDGAKVTTIDSFVEAPPTGVARSSRHQVVGVGSLTPRKGVEAMVASVALLHRRCPDLRAAWVGGPLDGPYGREVLHDRAQAGLDHVLDLPGAVDDVEPWWPHDGVVLHPAREDPAPLVVVEAALRHLPVVTWDTGGAADLLRAAGCGHLVAPAGDVVGLVERVDALLSAPPSDRADIGARLAAAAADRTVEVAGPQVLAAAMGTHR